MRRRELIRLIGGAAAAWSLAARAQQTAVKRIDALVEAPESDAEWQDRLMRFRSELQKLGWMEGRNLSIEVRRTGANPERMRAVAAEAIRSGPDAILTTSNQLTTIVGRQTRTIPIIFAGAGDAVGTGLVADMAHPAGNVTGFTNYESRIAGKKLELLKEAVPNLTRAAVLYTPGGAGSLAQLRVLEAAAPALDLSTTAIGALDTEEMERAINAFANEPNGGLAVLTGPAVITNRGRILSLAARHGLPAIYSGRRYVAEGGLMSYANSSAALLQGVASYMDRVLRGEKPGDLPVQLATSHQSQDRQSARPRSASGLARPCRRGDRMRRREFITLIGGAAAAWPLAALAQQPDRVRRVGVLLGVSEPEFGRRFKPFQDALARLGWVEPRNLRIDYRSAGNNRDVAVARARELLDLTPEVIFAAPGPMVEVLQRLTHTIPIVFSTNTNPVDAGYVQSYAHPGGNITGFTQVEGTVATKWLQLIKDVAPEVRRVGVLRPAGLARGRRDIETMQAAAGSVAVMLVDLLLVGFDELRATRPEDSAEIERVIEAFAREPNSGLIVPPSASLLEHRGTIVALAERYRAPTMYYNRLFADAGGLMSYGVDQLDVFRQAATYVDRILRGEKPGDLPVQTPTKYELVVNLKAAKSLGLMISRDFLLSADEVIE